MQALSPATTDMTSDRPLEGYDVEMTYCSDRESLPSRFYDDVRSVIEGEFNRQADARLAEQRRQKRQDALAVRRQNIMRLSQYHRAHHRCPARRNRRHHRVAAARAPSDGGDGPSDPPGSLAEVAPPATSSAPLSRKSRLQIFPPPDGRHRRLRGQVPQCPAGAAEAGLSPDNPSEHRRAGQAEHAAAMDMD